MGRGIGGACVTVWLWPSTVIVAVRLLVPVLAETEYLTVPSPLPLLPDVIVIQPAPSVAFHGVSHPLYDGVTVILPVPALGVNSLLGGEIE